MKITTNFSGANLKTARIVGQTVFLENNRDGFADDWFYFALCVEDAEGQTLTFQLSSILVISIKSKWLITLGKRDQMVLYHKNSFETNRDHFIKINGYHLQGDGSAIEYLKYIVEYDYCRMRNLLCIPKMKTPSPKKVPKDTEKNRKGQKDKSVDRQSGM